MNPTEEIQAGSATASPDQDPNYARRWWILALLGTAQLMVVLDATIVNIALPHAQVALGFSNSDRQWIVTGYSLAFGSLLLLGGRIADLFGRKQVFIIGIIGFAAASAFGGAAQNFAMLLTGRVVQGAFGALLAPATPCPCSPPRSGIRASAPRRWGSTAASPERARRSGCCSAGCSPST
jgi:sugar phosphate permease